MTHLKSNRTRTLSVGMLGSILMATCALANPVQWSTSSGGNGHWYAMFNFSDDDSSIFDAQDIAESLGCNVASVRSSMENTWIYQTFGNTRFGAYQDRNSSNYSEPNGGWAWISGEPWDYTTWLSGEPNNGSGNEDGVAVCCGGNWNDVRIDNGGAYLFEWSADCNDDGLVDYGQILDGSLTDDDGNGVPDICENTSDIDSIQWSTSSGGNGHWYEFIPVDQSWGAHNGIATSRGAHMVTITSSSEGEFVEYVRDTADSQAAFHTGGYQDYSAGDYSEPAGGWRWITGEPFQYTNWGYSDGDEQPNNQGGLQDRIGIRWQENQVWMDVNQTTEWYGMIEWSDDCNGDGIVDYGQILDGTLEDLDGNGVPDCCDNGAPCDGSFITVDDDGFGDFTTIQAAVDAAAQDAEILVYPGVYTGNGTEVVRLMGKNIQLRSLSGPELTIIDGENSRRCLVASDGESSIEIEGFTIANGNSDVSGGGIFTNSQSSLVLKDLVFTGNESGWEGGGLTIGNAIGLDISSCQFIGNEAFAGGGMALKSIDNPLIKGCLFQDNQTIDDGAGLLIQQCTEVLVENSDFASNVGDDDGGAMWIASSTQVMIKDCTMTGNTVTGRAGGVHVQSGAVVSMLNCVLEENVGHNGGGAFVDSTSSLAVNGCQFMHNVGDGGAIQAQGGTLELDQSEFVSNSGFDGGAIYCWNATVDVHECQFKDNQADDGGGAMLLGGGTQSSITYTRFCGNYAPNGQHVLGSIDYEYDNTYSDQCDCPSDVNQDGEVNVNDILTIIANFGTSNVLGDVDEDGFVDVNDLLLTLGSFGQTCG